MIEEFDLSKKIFKSDDGNVISDYEVKEFIRRLRERNTINHQITINDVEELAGEVKISLNKGNNMIMSNKVRQYGIKSNLNGGLQAGGNYR